MIKINEIRSALREAKSEGRFENYRITKTQEVHFYGTMPNTNQTGWYLAGSIKTPYQVEEIMRQINKA